MYAPSELLTMKERRRRKILPNDVFTRNGKCKIDMCLVTIALLLQLLLLLSNRILLKTRYPERTTVHVARALAPFEAIRHSPHHWIRMNNHMLITDDDI